MGRAEQTLRRALASGAVRAPWLTGVTPAQAHHHLRTLTRATAVGAGGLGLQRAPKAAKAPETASIPPQRVALDPPVGSPPPAPLAAPTPSPDDDALIPDADWGMYLRGPAEVAALRLLGGGGDGSEGAA